MKNVLLIGAAALALTACTQVKPGHVAIKINQYGSGSGVDPVAKGVGTYWTPIGTSYEVYPVSTQTYPWARSTKEGSGENEELTFQDKSGVDMSADVAVVFHVDAALAPALYQKFRMDIQPLIDGPVRNAVRNALVNEAAKMPVEDIYGTGKTQLINAALVDVKGYFKPYGLDIEQLYWASGIRVPATISQQITQRVANENAALAAQAAVATATAEANAQREAAKGKADAMALEATALRSNPEMAQLRAIEKWDGTLPTTMTGGAMPFLSVGPK